MNYRHLLLRCDCGEIPERIAEVGFTEDHQLVIHWWCTRCERVVYITKPLTDCWRDCPGPDRSLDHTLAAWGAAGKESAAGLESEGALDAKFLRSIGVRG